MLAATLPTDAIVVDESLTTGRSFLSATRSSRPHDWLLPTGGSIGFALPAAAGAAIACADRKVLCLESDGSGMYMPQALWTHAREGLNILTIVFANRKYQILRLEMQNVGVKEIGAKASLWFTYFKAQLSSRREWKHQQKLLLEPKVQDLIDILNRMAMDFKKQYRPTVIGND